MITIRELLAQLDAETPLAPDLPERIGQLLAAPMSATTPWYIHGLVAFGASIAALLLLVFTGMIGAITSGAGAITVGGTLIVAAIALRFMVRSVSWLAQLPLAFSMVGALMVFGGALLIDGSFDSTLGLSRALLALALVELLLILFYPDQLRRLLSTLLLALIICWLLLINELPLAAALFVAALGWAVALLWLHEPLLSRRADILRPVAYGLVFGLFACLVSLLFGPATPRWPLSLALAAALAYAAWSLLAYAALQTRLVALLGVLLLLLPAWETPGILAAALVLLLGFSRGNRILVGLGGLFLAGFIGFFYYSLAATLLVKSFALVGAGLLLLAARAVVLRASARAGLL